jgi:hypothetical protein
MLQCSSVEGKNEESDEVEEGEVDARSGWRQESRGEVKEWSGKVEDEEETGRVNAGADEEEEGENGEEA